MTMPPPGWPGSPCSWHPVDGCREGPGRERTRHRQCRLGSVTFGQMTRNSSPARRPTTSPDRTDERIRSATRTSTSSPVAWPNSSLTGLKRSRSMKMAAVPAGSAPSDVYRGGTRNPKITRGRRWPARSMRDGSGASRGAASTPTTPRQSLPGKFQCVGVRRIKRPVHNTESLQLLVSGLPASRRHPADL